MEGIFMTESIDAKLARLMCYYDNIDRQGLIAALCTELSALAAAQAEPAHPLQDAKDAAINYDVLFAFAESSRCNYNQLCAAVRAAIDSTKASQAVMQAAQAVLDRWNCPRWEWHKQGPTADLMHALQKAMQAVQPDYTVHSCSYFCENPACIKQQRDELRDKAVQLAEPLTMEEKQALFLTSTSNQHTEYESYLQGIEDGETYHGIKKGKP